MKTPATDKPTKKPSPRTERPATGYVLTTARGHQLLVRRPDGRPLRARPSGRRPASDRIQSGQSYLQVPAA